MVAPTISAPSKNPANGPITVFVKIKRCDGPGKPSRWESFKLDYPNMSGINLISMLQDINANPVTTEGKNTTPVVYDAGCLEEVCGSCTMLINGKVRQSCTALLSQVIEKSGDTVTVEPMTKFPVIRDLSVDRERMFHYLRKLEAWVPVDGTYHLGAGPRETPEQQQTRYKLSTCMSCGCCLEACPQFTLEADPEEWDTAFIGAAAISQARYFNLHETGKTLAGHRLDVLAGPGGVTACGNAQNCVKVCPKEIPLTESIAAMGRAVVGHKIKQIFAGR